MDHSQSCMADPEKTARSLIVASKLVASGRLPQAAVGLVLQLVSIVEQCTENYNPRMREEAQNSLENDVDKYLCVPVSYSLTAEKVDEWLSDDVKQGERPKKGSPNTDAVRKYMRECYLSTNKSLKRKEMLRILQSFLNHKTRNQRGQWIWQL